MTSMPLSVLGQKVQTELVTNREGILTIEDSEGGRSIFTIPCELVEVKIRDRSVLDQFIDPSVVEYNEQHKLINWDPIFTILIPMKTLSDHNCLCHGLAIAIWGSQVTSCYGLEAMLYCAFVAFAFWHVKKQLWLLWPKEVLDCVPQTHVAPFVMYLLMKGLASPKLRCDAAMFQHSAKQPYQC